MLLRLSNTASSSRNLTAAWHRAVPNFSPHPRKALFLGYSFRWLKPRDEMTVAQYLPGCGPIRRQLLGADGSGKGLSNALHSCLRP